MHYYILLKNFIYFHKVLRVASLLKISILQEILRSLGKTILVKILVKKRTAQLEKDTREAGRKIQDELNDQVRKWGIDVQKVELSSVKIMKPPESGSTTAVGSILRGLGVKRDEKYLTQQDVVRASHGSFDQKGSLMSQGS